jgi:hypothetical protein
MTTRLVEIVRAEKVACPYCHAPKKHRCQFVLVPGMQVSVEWTHRSRQERSRP